MTIFNDIFTETTPVNSGFAGDTITLKISEINAEITALNTKLNKNFPIYDTPSDNFEKFFHCLLILIKLREIDNNNTGFNLKINTPQAGAGAWNGIQKQQRTYPLTMPFGSDLDSFGDSDNLG
jgi:hypothetical protein